LKQQRSILTLNPDTITIESILANFVVTDMLSCLCVDIPDLKQYEVFDTKNQQAWRTFKRKQLEKKGKILAEGNEPAAWFETQDLWNNEIYYQQEKHSVNNNNTFTSTFNNNNNNNIDKNEGRLTHCVLKYTLPKPKVGKYLLISKFFPIFFCYHSHSYSLNIINH
jgi:hypothetical protein